MAKRGSPLGFATVGNTTVSSFFAFITGATTVSGLFLGLFGLTSFSYILVGDPNVSLYTVLQALSMLPNPLEFVRDCNEILMVFRELVELISYDGNSAGNDILKVLLSTFTVILNILAYIFAFAVSAILLPFYLVSFLLRCVAVLLIALGMKWDFIYALTQPWKPVSFIIGVIRGVL